SDFTWHADHWLPGKNPEHQCGAGSQPADVDRSDHRAGGVGAEAADLLVAAGCESHLPTKHEIPNPKEIRRSKYEKRCLRSGSGFGFLSDFGFRTLRTSEFVTGSN